MSQGMHNLSPAEGSTHRKKRVGRGIGSGHGKTSTRGHKGDKARGSVNPNFEGGQTALHRRLPMYRGVQHRNPNGFTKIRDRSYAIVNLSTLQANFDVGAEVTIESLVAMRLLRDEDYGLRPLQKRVKVLADGDLSKQLTVHAHKFSEAAKLRIEELGGTANLIGKNVDSVPATEAVAVE